MPDPVLEPTPQDDPFDKLVASAKTQAFKTPGVALSVTPPEIKPPDDVSFLGGLADIGLSPARGLVNAGVDFYNLVDHLGGTFGYDLPDAQRWEARTGVGSFLSDAFQLTAGYGVAGALTKGVGLVGALGKLGKAGKVANFVADNFIGDTLFYHTDKNIARMLKDNDLGSPLTDWLATEDDDSELKKRMLGALDGIGLGGVTHGIMSGLKGYKAGRAQKALLNGLLSGDPDKIAKYAASLSESQAAVADSLAVNSAAQAKNQKLATKVRKAEFKEDVLVDATLNGVGLNSEEARLFIHTGVSPGGTYNTLPKGGTPFDRAVRILRAGKRELLDIHSAPSAAAGLRAYEGLIRDAAEATIKNGGVLDYKHIDRAYGNLKNWLGLNGGSEATFLTRLGQQTQLVSKNMDVELAAKLVSSEAIMQELHNDLKRRLAIFGTPAYDTNAVKVAELIDVVEKAGDYVREIKGLNPSRSRLIGDIPTEVTNLHFGGAVKDTTTLKGTPGIVREPSFSGARRSPVASLDYVNSKGGKKVVDRMLSGLQDSLNKNEEAALLNTDINNPSRTWDMISEWWINGILSHGQTHIVNLVSNIAATLYRPMETILGGVGQVVGSAATFNRAGLSEGFKTAQHGLKLYSELTTGFLDTIGLLGGRHGGPSVRKAFLDAFRTGDSQLLQGLPGKLEYNSHAINSQNLGATLENPFHPALANFLTGLSDRSLFTLGAAQSFDKIGNLIRLPQRVLSASDELFKQLNYRAKTRSILFDEARVAGIPVNKQGEYVANRFENILRDGQALTASSIQKETIQRLAETKPEAFKNGSPLDKAKALNSVSPVNDEGFASNWRVAQQGIDYAKEVTFTSDLGKFTNAIKTAIVHAPVLRLVMPFITTPVNLLKFAYNRSIDPLLGLPIHMLDRIKGTISHYSNHISMVGTPAMQKSWNKFATDMLHTNPVIRGDALGRLAFAVGTISTAMTLATNSMDQDATLAITGRGPHDSVENKGWQGAGNLPYSIRIGKMGAPGTKSIQYNRLDPFGSILGMVSDLTTYSHFASPQEQQHLDSWVGAALSTLGNNLVNKTYLSNIADALTVMQGEDPNKINTILRQFGASFLIPNALNSPALGGEEENTLREVHSFIDAKLNRTPWGAGQLQPQRNPLGEPIKRIPQWGEDSLGRWMAFWSPFKVNTVKGDAVLEEMARLQHPFKPTPDDMSVGGIKIDLAAYKNAKGQTAEDRYAELVGERNAQGVNIRDVLGNIIKSSQYKGLPEFSGGDPLDNPKVKLLGSIFTAFRGQAKAKVIKEFPEIQKFIKEQSDRRRNAR